jgi:cysteine synthase
MSKAIFGPNYDEMLYPERIPEEIRKIANKELMAKDEMNPLNLFNLNWKDENLNVRKVVLPKAMTGIEANIVVLLGNGFPSGSQKVGPVYSEIAEATVDGTITPKENTILGPSTGNFGIGTAYISNLTKYKSIVIMPDNMSKERYEKIRGYGSELDLTPGTESDVILTVFRTIELKKNEKNYSLDQFELCSNYRFHRYVTGNSAIEAVKGVGNGRAAAYVVCTGSAGTLAAGDELKNAFPECKTIALEPYECPTLTQDARGQHRIEGIGDKLISLIHNVNQCDFVTLIHDDDAVQALKVVHDGSETLIKNGVDPAFAEQITDLFGVTGMANMIGAIKMAKYLKLGPGDNIVTIASDGFDRYQSVIDNLEVRYLELEPFVLDRWWRDVVLRADEQWIYDFRTEEAKKRLYTQKELDWPRFGYTIDFLDQMKEQSYWDGLYEEIPSYNKKILENRGTLEEALKS